MIYILLGLALIIGLYFILIAPSTKKINTEAFLEWDYAHRGLFDNSLGIPENTMPAIEKALAYNYGMEFDVQITKDKRLILFHDWTMKRMSGLDKKIKDLSLKEIYKHNILDTDLKPPLFTDVLEKVDGKVPLIIELKGEGKDIDEICFLTSQILDNYKGPFMVESFNPLIVRWFKKNRPQYIRGQLSSGKFEDQNIFASFFMKYLLVNILSRPHFIAYEHIYKKNLSLNIINNVWDIPLVAYTVKSSKAYNKAKPPFNLIIFEGFMPN